MPGSETEAEGWDFIYRVGKYATNMKPSKSFHSSCNRCLTEFAADTAEELDEQRREHFVHYDCRPCSRRFNAASVEQLEKIIDSHNTDKHAGAFPSAHSLEQVVV